MKLVPLVLVSLLASASAGRPPSTNPSAAIESTFVQLADRDPDVRERARVELMGIRREQLALLEKVVAQHQPIQPTQAAVLYDIVMHVYMAGEPYQAVEDAGGFLGLRGMEEWTSPPGVLVTVRIPGFCAYRSLREGDVIVGIKEYATVQFDHLAQFTNLMGGVKPGTTLTFRVLRNGQVRDVPIRLDARPAAAARGMPPEPMERLENARATKAEEYWNRAFAPLLGQGSVTSSRP